ncbi:MAG: DUF4421 family protein [Prevotella sp.]|nr:DUF4421 family protein [Prevotella sp.]
MKGRIIICCLLFTLNAAAQEQADTDSVSRQDSSTSLMSKLRYVQQFLDNRARAKVDPHYIEVPEKPWRVILRYKETAVDVDYENDFYFPEDKERLFWKLCFEPPVAASVGFWVGYRGTGISYSHSLVKNAGRYFSISSTGAKYGFNFRHRRFSTDEVTFNTKYYQDEKVVEEQNIHDKIGAPVWIRSTYINGYYVFNGRHYSQAAAYNQSVIQRRSAGSLLAGATWYQSSFDLSAAENSLFVLLSKNVGRIKMHQANIGIGYGYNFVPFRGFVINAMAMPTLSVYNRVKVYKYDYNYYPLDEIVKPLDSYGQWNSQTHTWANGEKYKPMDEEGKYLQDVEGWEIENDVNYGRLQFNVDLRLGIAYNWSNYFIGLQGQFNRFSYKMNETKVVLIDSYARLSLGMRL